MPQPIDVPSISRITGKEMESIELKFDLPEIFAVDESTGNKCATEVNFAVEVTADGNRYFKRSVFRIVGKSDSPFRQMRTVNRPKCESTWGVSVVRLTPVSRSPFLRNYVDFGFSGGK